MDIEYDLYVHTYSNHSYYKKSKITIDYKIIYQLKPQIFINEDQFIFDSKIDYKSFQNKGDPWNNNYRSLINSIRALNSLWRTSIALEKSNIKYDFVVFLRPDVMYLNKIPFSFLLKYPDHLLIPDFHRPCSGGKVNDRMAMGNMKNMMVYGKRFEKALNYSKFKKLHSETFLYDVLKYRWSIYDRVHIKNKCRVDFPSFEEHIKNINSDEYKVFYKAFFGELEIGLIYLNKKDEDSTFILPNLLKKALKKYKNQKKETDFMPLGALIHKRFFENLPEIKTHYARVNPENKLSLRTLLDNGYEIVEYVLAIKTENGKVIQGKWKDYEPI
jgi:hypothetical protein